MAAFWVFAIPAWCRHFGWGADYLQDVHPFLVPFLMPVFHMFITGSDYLNLASVSSNQAIKSESFIITYDYDS